jgi:hypothetical protein
VMFGQVAPGGAAQVGEVEDGIHAGAQIGGAATLRREGGEEGAQCGPGGVGERGPGGGGVRRDIGSGLRLPRQAKNNRNLVLSSRRIGYSAHYFYTQNG